ncbi:hypothetical protein [Shewanella sp.]|uniref:hypothetical protein n=1 Tax=Shewanella sp. TaxID=50422 RepID=UPI001ECE6A25|nr:hypothetical protein [Shewanella sp.]NRB25937.1 hypothetical protein [Shewanella sp.]
MLPTFFGISTLTHRAYDIPYITQAFPTLTHRACDIPDITQAFPTSLWVRWEMS